MELSENKSFEKINTVLKNGGVIAFVTDTVWGVGCLPNNKKGVEKIYSLKHREAAKPLILMSDKKKNLLPYVKNVCKKAEDVMNKHFPGALTVVLERSDKTPLFITSNKETVGIRVPNNKIFQKLCQNIDGHVLATTSANISGEPPALDYKTAYEKLKDLVDIIIEDEDEHATGEPSTVLQIMENNVIIFRQGSVKIKA